ncbi:MAG: 30S ribosomal protein S2 [Sulfolobales archaeon]|nr:30S ribosomal protein S2 [Sulfolobales archaeon]MCX8208835.1 30S ribosomal protein S2 [Sulfolobales archaeon]MDW8010140.1 30S ribosomal protein S2 [Sulfolobales archaeon]
MSAQKRYADEAPKIISELLVPAELYLEAGVHIGTYVCTKYMKRFVYKSRPDGPYILDIRKIDERLRIAAKFIASFDLRSVLAVSSRPYGFTPVQKFAEFTGARHVVGRFIPGTITNPYLDIHVDAEVLLASDPRVDEQAIEEASKVGIPVVAIASTDAKLSNVDLVVPGNNKGRKSLALIYWLLARQVLRERGVLQADGNLPVSYEVFETKVAAVER